MNSLLHSVSFGNELVATLFAYHTGYFDPIKKQSPSDAPSDTHYISFGRDSYVYRSGSNVIKFYRSDRSGDRHLHELTDYQKITKDADDYCVKHSLTCTFGNKTLPVRINPIDSVFFSKKANCVVGISAFVGGESPQEAFPIPAEDISKEIFQIGKNISRGMKLTGIRTISQNVRIVDNTVVVTDLCCRIYELAIA